LEKQFFCVPPSSQEALFIDKQQLRPCLLTGFKSITLFAIASKEIIRSIKGVVNPDLV
jgi:hypothetical protein